jgi:thymidylate synthase (FAD)
MLDQPIKTLDKGYVSLSRTNLFIPQHGFDEDVAHAARASFMHKIPGMCMKNIRLLKYLAEHGHTSPFRHTTLTFEIKAPMMVARQWFKYRVGSVHSPDTAELLGICVPPELSSTFWPYVQDVLGFVGQGDDGSFDPLHARNEASRRYVTLEPEFYIPEVWRAAPENKKQGSGGPAPETLNWWMRNTLKGHVEDSLKLYDLALKNGVCAEQARLFLPMYGLYTVWRWTCSTQAVAHFLNQRLGEDAQVETQEYAASVYSIAMPLFEYSLGRLVRRPNEETDCSLGPVPGPVNLSGNG